MANKEHIYQFAVSIDEEAIVNRMVNNLEKEMRDEIKKQVEAVMLDRWGDPRQWVKDCLSSWLDENKEAIIDKTTEALVNKLYRTKAVKEMVAKIGQEGGAKNEP